jgi:hypothetical protein
MRGRRPAAAFLKSVDIEVERNMARRGELPEPVPSPARLPRGSVPGWIAGIAVALAALPGNAQIAQVNVRPLTLAGISDCLTEAIATNTVEDDGAVAVFSCSAATARALYDFLGQKIRAEIVEDSDGKFENRAFGNSVCYHRIADAAGKFADEFRCDLVMAIGEALGE